MKNRSVLTALCALAFAATPTLAAAPRVLVSTPAAQAGTRAVEGVPVEVAGAAQPLAFVELGRDLAFDPGLATAESLQASAAPALIPCPTGATCLTLPGTFFTSTRNEPMRIYKLLVPVGRKYRRMETTFRFTLTEWNADPRGIFTLIYLNRNGKFRSNTLAVIDIARDQRRVHLETTLGLPNVGPPAGVQNEREKVTLQRGTTYDVKYVYDAENLRFHLQMRDNKGALVVDLEEDLWSTTRQIESRGSFWIQFSEPFGTSLHVPSLGWKHTDLTFALIP